MKLLSEHYCVIVYNTIHHILPPPPHTIVIIRHGVNLFTLLCPVSGESTVEIMVFQFSYVNSVTKLFDKWTIYFNSCGQILQ